jgi:hypothetical protein
MQAHASKKIEISNYLNDSTLKELGMTELIRSMTWKPMID